MKSMYCIKQRSTGSRLAAAAVLLCSAVLLSSDEMFGEDKRPAATPELTARVTEFFKKVDQARRPRLDERMAAEIADIAKATGLGPDGVKALRAAAVVAEDAAQAEQLANQIKEKPAEYAAFGEEALKEFDQPEAIQQMAAAPETIAYTAPTEQPAWTEALARTLTPEQAATWEKTRSERTATMRKEIDAFLDARIKQYRVEPEQSMHTLSRAISDALKLSKERAEKVDALATQAVDASEDRWRQGATKSLLSRSSAQRSAIFKSRGFYFAGGAANAPEKLAVWTEGIAKLLTDDERARLQATKDEQRSRRVQALGQLMVALLDEKIAFTTDQRSRLEPVAKRLVQTRKAFFPEAGENTFSNTFSPTAFYQVSAEARPEELDAVLDETQRQRWRALKDDKTEETDDDGSLALKASPTPASPDANSPGEPEDLEQMVSDYVLARSAANYREAESSMILRAEDATRIAGVAPPNAARLQTAARGAAKAATDAWLPNIEQNVRSAVQGATRENLPQKLGSIASYYFTRRAYPADDALWNATVKTELTAAQQAAWQAERDAREQYHDAAVAQYLTMGFDQRVGLSAEQWKAVLPLITKAFRDYRPDIERMFSYSNSTPWYLSSYYMFMPLQSVTEEQFKALLTKEQWDQWSGSSEFGNTASYWDNIKENHESRVKEEKEKAEKEGKKP